MNEVVGRVPSQGRNTFIKNAMILSLGGILVKVLGFYRIPLAAILGPVGMGLFQYAYPIFNALLAISAAASIPTAISKMVSERLARRQFRSAQKIFQVALVMLFILGAMGTVIMIAGARFVAEVIIGDPRAYFPLVAIAPAILIVSVMASLRGYFQGMQTMVPSAASQVVEQAGRVLAALILAYLLLPRGLEFAAGGASFGVVIGSAFGLALLALLYWYRGQQLRFSGGGADEPGREGAGRIALEITRLSVPITLAALVSPIIQLIDTVIVPRRLQIAGFTPEAATGLYGQLTGFAAPLMNLPQIFTVALAAS
ncbi:MAG: polysaccharide biosynthesis protein, partial [Firmicutes bacterium]|nr:polysaccharide biosynthesis protein [Bacillota bacterium]